MNGNDIFFNVLFECEICKPVEEQQLKCVIKNITRAGIKCEYYDQSDASPIIVFIAKESELSDKEIRNFSKYKIGDNIDIKVIGVRYELYDEYISIIASIV